MSLKLSTRVLCSFPEIEMDVKKGFMVHSDIFVAAQFDATTCVLVQFAALKQALFIRTACRRGALHQPRRCVAILGGAEV